MEAVLFAAGDSVSIRKLSKSIEMSVEDTQELLMELRNDYNQEERGIHLQNFNDNWQISTKPEYYHAINTVLGLSQRTTLSQASLATLSIIAYRQPVTRADIEQLRGVSSSSSLQNLLDRDLIKETGRLEAPGRPILYGTTDGFLKTLNFSSLEDLPEFQSFADDKTGFSDEDVEDME